MIDKTKIFPILIIILYIGASIINFKVGDWKRGLYWLFAIGLNCVVTF